MVSKNTKNVYLQLSEIIAKKQSSKNYELEKIFQNGKINFFFPYFHHVVKKN